MPEISGMIQQFLEGNIKTLSAEPVIESKTITENGTYTAPEGVDGYSPVVVNVPPTEPVIESKTITENGTYTAPEGVDGYSPVVVNVPQPTLSTLEVSDNGDYDAPSGTAYNRVEVNVPLPENAYLLKSVSNLPQPIASFSDGAVAPMMGLKIAIEPVQSGSGDPSPTNIRTISGWSGANISVNTINIFDKIKLVADRWLNISNGALQEITGRYATVDYLPCKPNVRYYCASYNGDTPQTATYELLICWYDKNKNFISGQNANLVNSSLTFPSNAYYYRLGTLHNYDITINYPNTEHAYIPYNGHTYTIDLDGTRYGGTLDVVSGVCKPYKEYDSYNGETLVGPWMSDRDVYAEGTTPTIGAQVVDMGAYDTDVATQPTAITTLLGDNNISADTGDIEVVEYLSKEV